jgi:hypothetical protein
MPAKCCPDTPLGSGHRTDASPAQESQRRPQPPPPRPRRQVPLPALTPTSAAQPTPVAQYAPSTAPRSSQPPANTQPMLRTCHRNRVLSAPSSTQPAAPHRSGAAPRGRNGADRHPPATLGRSDGAVVPCPSPRPEPDRVSAPARSPSRTAAPSRQVPCPSHGRGWPRRAAR